MSVINESEKGDELLIIEEFEGPPEGERPALKANRNFRIGERVRYLGFFRSENLKDNPVCWMVRFEAADGKTYAATQTYFVTVECWQGLKKYFARRLLRDPKPMRTPTVDKQPTQ